MPGVGLQAPGTRNHHPIAAKANHELTFTPDQSDMPPFRWVCLYLGLLTPQDVCVLSQMFAPKGAKSVEPSQFVFPLAAGIPGANAMFIPWGMRGN